ILLLDACLENGFLIFLCTAFPRRDWPTSYARPDWFPGARRPADVSYAVPDSGYTWSETQTPENPARDLRPDISEYERWLYSFGPY
ncbi:hypothetical protein XENOCAPTIV_027094, partial [Xenoophorus captivus]